MRPPELTYAFSVAKDVSGPTLELYKRVIIQTEDTATLEVRFLGIPKDKAFILTTASITVSPGALASLDFITLALAGPGEASVTVKRERQTGGGGSLRIMNFQGEAWVLGGHANGTILAVAEFDVAHANNQVIANVFGFLIPRANIAVF